VDIAVDPYYLTSKAESLGYYPEVNYSGRRINDNMGAFIANKVVKLMIQKKHTIKGARVLVLGITFKENCPDLRNSKVIDVINELKEFGIDLNCSDPQADADKMYHEYKLKMVNEIGSEQYSAVALAVSHKEFSNLNYKSLLAPNEVLFDVKPILPEEMVDGRL